MSAHRLLAIPVSLLVLLSACSSPDYEAQVDEKVTQQWMRPGMYVDAIEYLESDGYYYSADDVPGAIDLDQEAIVPLLKEMQERFQQEQYAILVEDEDYAWGIVMKLPPDDAKQKQVRSFLEEAKQNFPGMILEEWGHQWLSLDFLDAEEAALIREAEAAS